MTSAAGIGLATVCGDGTVLDTWFPSPGLGSSEPTGTSRLSGADVPADFSALAGPDPERGVEIVSVRTVIGSLADKPVDTYDAYLRLHLLSHRLVKPHAVNLDGIFGVLTNVVWTNHGPCRVEGFEDVRLRLRRRGPQINRAAHILRLAANVRVHVLVRLDPDPLHVRGEVCQVDTCARAKLEDAPTQG